MLRLHIFCLILLLLLAPGAAGKKKKKPPKLSNTMLEQFVNATNSVAVLHHPAAIQARKMSHLIKRQDVVSTCRYILFKEKLNFWDAKEACHKLQWPFTHKGAWLADVHSEEENHDFRILLQIAYGIRQTGGNFHRDNWVWVGLEKKINNNHVLPKQERGVFNASEWQWLDGTHPNFTNFMRGMPDQMKKGKHFQNHIQINKRGRWDDTFAHIEAPYACNYCGRYIVIAEHVTWPKARELCTSYGLQMAIVNSKHDHVEFGMAVNATFGPGHELKRWDNSNWIWLGTYERMENNTGTGEWMHVDGTPVGWSPIWDYKRQPDNWVLPRGEQSVVAYSRINKKWDDSYTWRKRPFACMCPYRSCSYDALYKGDKGGDPNPGGE